MEGAWFRRNEVKLLALCMVLLGTAAAWLISTRPGHRIEGDYFEREIAGRVDDWLVEQARTNPVYDHRARACWSLGRIGGERARDALIAAANDQSPTVRGAAAFGLGLLEDAETGSLPPSERTARALRRLIKDNERQTVANAVEALGRMEWREAARPISLTPAPLVYTLTAIARMDARELLPEIAQVLYSDDQDNRWAAAVALNWMDAPCNDDIRRSFTNLTRDRNDFVRAAVTAGLGVCEPNDAMLAALANMAQNKDPKVRIEAVRSIARLGREDLREAVVGLLGDRNPNVQAEAIRALAPVADEALTALLRAHPAAKLVGPPAPRMPEAVGGAVISTEGSGWEPDELQRIARTVGRVMRLETTDGTFDLELDYDHAPLASEWFFEEARAGKFAGAQIVRVRGDGYVQIPLASDRPPPPPERNPSPFLRGTLGMIPGTRELFIALTPLPFADGKYVNFGRLTSGDDLLDHLTIETQVISVTTVAR